jgi:hypothetical protein
VVAPLARSPGGSGVSGRLSSLADELVAVEPTLEILEIERPTKRLTALPFDLPRALCWDAMSGDGMAGREGKGLFVEPAGCSRDNTSPAEPSDLAGGSPCLCSGEATSSLCPRDDRSPLSSLDTTTQLLGLESVTPL